MNFLRGLDQMTVEQFENDYIKEEISQLPRCAISGGYIKSALWKTNEVGRKIYFEYDAFMRKKESDKSFTIKLIDLARDYTQDCVAMELIDFVKQEPKILTQSQREHFMLSQLLFAIFSDDPTEFDKFTPFLSYYVNKTYNFKTILHYATASSTDSEKIKMLLDAGARVEPYPIERASAWHLRASAQHPLRTAVTNGNQHLAKLFLEYGAKIDTELHLAIRNPEMTKILLAHGADANAIDSKGNTALHIAQNKEVVELLLQHGADIDVKNAQGYTALDMFQAKVNPYLGEPQNFLGSRFLSIPSRIEQDLAICELLKAQKLRREAKKAEAAAEVDSMEKFDLKDIQESISDHELLNGERLESKNKKDVEEKARQDRVASDLAFIEENQKNKAFHYLGLEEDPDRIIFNPENISQYIADWLSGISEAEGYVKRVCQENNIRFFELLNELPETEASQLFGLILEGAEDPSLLWMGASHHFVGLIWSADDASSIAKLSERANGLGLTDILKEDVIVNRILETGALIYLEDPALFCAIVQSSGIASLGEENKQVIAETLFQSGLKCENGEEAFATIISLLFDLKDHWSQSNSPAGKEEIIFDFYAALLMQNAELMIELAGKNPSSFKALLGGMSTTQMNLLEDKPFYVELMAQPEIKRLFPPKKTVIDYNDPNEELAWSTCTLTGLFVKDQEEQEKAEFSFFRKQVTKPKPVIINKVNFDHAVQSDQKSAGESMTEWDISIDLKENQKEEKKEKESCLVM